MSTSQILNKSDGASFHDPHLYRSIVRGLQYLSFTRPELAFAIHKVSKYMHDPKEPHWVAVKRILRYLKETISHALLIQPDHLLQLQTLVMQIGHPIRMIEDQLVLTVSILAKT